MSKFQIVISTVDLSITQSSVTYTHKTVTTYFRDMFNNCDVTEYTVNITYG